MSNNKTILITDLDNTLFNWVDFFAPTFRAMVHVLSKKTGIDEDTIISDFDRIYQKHGSVEYPYSVQELNILQGYDSEEIDNIVELSKKIYVKTGRRHLKLYDGVKDTLLWANKTGIRVICMTNAPINLAVWRLTGLGIIKHFYGVAGRSVSWEIKKPKSKKRYYWFFTQDELSPKEIGYKRIIDTFQIPKTNIYIIGDSLYNDVFPALRLGVIAIWAKYGIEADIKNRETINKISTISKETIIDINLEESENIFIAKCFSDLQTIIYNPPQMIFPGF